MLICLSRRVLGLDGGRPFKRRWLCFYVIKDLLDDVWISDVGDDTQGTAGPNFKHASTSGVPLN